MHFVFGDHVLDPARRELRRGAELIEVEPQVFDLLLHLIRNRDRVVSKDDLLDTIWQGRIVADSTISSRIAAARRAVGDSADRPLLIRTIARRGIRFVGEVREDRSSGGAGAPQQSPHVERDTVALASPGPPPPLPDKPSIAVLPFTNMSGDPEQEYFSDGITEDIITALSRLRWFFVIARNSTFVYKGQAVDVRSVGRDLGVRYVLEGSVRKSGQRMRITSQLLEATTGNHIWTERYDRELTDIFALQDEITASVTAAIEPKLIAAEGMRTETRSIDDLNAWDLVARALSHFGKMTAADNDAAIATLRQTVVRHPTYAPAHSILAFALLVSFQVGWMPTSGNKEIAARLAHRAAELDDSDPWAHMALGYLAITDRRTDEAARHFQVALDLNPNFAAAYGYTGWALVLDGQSEEALRHFSQWMRMSPRDPLTGFFCAGLSAAHYFAGRYNEAIKWARQGVQLRPGMPAGHRMLCASLAQAGLIDEARSAMAYLRKLQPTLSVAWVKQSVPYTARPMALFLDGLRKAGLTN
jgi:TolB-like protein/Flp pilus assembly protein TadD